MGERLSVLGLLRFVAQRRGVLIDRSARRQTAHQPPQFLVSLAAAAGFDLTRYRFALSARGRYNSNKIVFYLFEGLQQGPEIVVKMTRAPEFNFRLANEAAVLTRLKQTDFVEPGTYPELLVPCKYGGESQGAFHRTILLSARIVRTFCSESSA